MRIAIMQPYFLPYAGYFRLLAGVDAFYLYDDVQFPRRGWVHRNRLRRADGRAGWLTLPLAYAPLGTGIRDLEFHPEAADLWPRRLDAFPVFRRPAPAAAGLVDEVHALGGRPADYLDGLLRSIATALDLHTPILTTAGVAVAPGLAGVERVIALCRAVGATQYLNAPGGRDLYPPEPFRRHGLRLGFLPPYEGDPASILQRLHDGPVADLRREILAGLARADWLD